MGKTEKWKENHETKVTKIPKTKRRKYGMNKTSLYTKLGSKRLLFSLNFGFIVDVGKAFSI